MPAPTTIIFAGGGTGGHLFPGIAVAQEWLRQEPDARIVFVGSERELEQQILRGSGLEHRPLTVESLRELIRHPFRFIARNWSAWGVARRLIAELQPQAVIGLGGFASGPIVWEASRARRPVVLLEQNVIPGRTTTWLSRKAAVVCVSFDETIQHLPKGTSAVRTGNPVRSEIIIPSDPEDVACARELLVLGGSQGAAPLNEALIGALPFLKEALTGWKVVHQTGPRQVESVREAYESHGIPAVVEPFFDDLARRYRSAGLVVSRSGATTLAELTCCGLPMVLVPYPQAARDHQRANAHSHVQAGAARLVEQATSLAETSQQLAAALKPLLTDESQRRAMSHAARQTAQPQATAAVADQIRRLIAPDRQ